MRAVRLHTVPRTEERIFPASRRPNDGMAAEHWARYRFVAPALRGRVLDIGCGTGYGAREIARASGVQEVVGVDRSADALAWADRYYPHPAVARLAADLERGGWERGLGSFDSMVAFEVVEHLRDESPFWRGARRVLRHGGVLWLSTPLGRGRGRGAADPYHIHQLRRSEVAALFNPDEWELDVFGQVGSWIEPWRAGCRYYTALARGRLR